MESLLRDLRFGLRGLSRRPGLTIIAVLSLGLGIGANATVFTWLNGFVLRPLPSVPAFGRLVAVNTRSPGGGNWSVSYPSLRDWREQATKIDFTAAELMQIGMRGEHGEVERVWGALVGGNYFDVLRTPASLGRTLTLRDELDHQPVAVLGYSFWQTRFQGDSSVIGRHITLNGQDLAVVGVAAPRFGGTMVGLRMDLFLPVTVRALWGQGEFLTQRGWQWMDGMARLKDGVRIDEARAELDAIARRISASTGDRDSHNGINMRPFTDQGAASFMKPVLLALLGVTSVVLLIACANVANILLARALARRREIGIRLALGANRPRLVRQLFTESLALGLLAGGVGVMVAFWSRDLIGAFVPPAPFPIAIDMRVGTPVLVFTLVVTAVTAVIFGLAPAVQASNPELVPTLKDDIGGAPSRRSRLQSSLVVAQVALSIVSLVCAGLFTRSLGASRHADVGFTGAERTLLVSTDFQLANVKDSLMAPQMTALLERLRAIPGVEAASVIMRAPLGFGGQTSMTAEVEGYVPQADENMSLEYQMVGSDYFRAQGVPLLSGRGIVATDVQGAPTIAVVNEEFVRRYWHGQDAIGKRFRQGGSWRTVVGVAKQGYYHSLTDAPIPLAYLPWAQGPSRNPDVLLRSTGNDPKALAAAARRAFQETNPDLPVLDVRTMAEHMQAALFIQQMGATMLAVLGVIALALSAFGIYGVVSYNVGRRTREIGLRVALGAARRDVIGLVVGGAMRLVMFGVLIGLLGAVGVGQLLRSQLVGVSPHDPLTFALIATVLATVAFVASVIPARRASRVDAMIALRYE